MPRKEVKGAAESLTLASDISDSATSITSSETPGAGWPTGTGSKPFVIRIDNEKILCSARSGTGFTVTTRGYDGTTAAAHTGGIATIKHVIDAVSINEFFAHLYDEGAAGSAHAASKIANTPAGNIAATTVQAAIDELDSEKAASSHSHVTGDITSLAEYIRDTIGTALQAGTDITVTVNDGADTITIASSADMSALPQGIQDYAEITSDFTTATTTATDVTDLSVTITTDGTRRFRIEIGCGFSERASLLIREGSTQLASWNGQSWGSTPSSPDRVMASGTRSVILTPSAGSHTYKFSVDNFTNTGTVLVAASATNPAYILAEDIGPA